MNELAANAFRLNFEETKMLTNAEIEAAQSTGIKVPSTTKTA